MERILKMLIAALVSGLGIYLAFSIISRTDREEEPKEERGRKENLTVLYNEFTDEYIVDNIYFRISPDDTGTIMRYIAQCDIEFNNKNTEVLRGNVRKIDSCMKNQRIKSLHELSDEQWSALKGAFYDLTTNIGLTVEYNMEDGISFINKDGQTEFVISHLDSRGSSDIYIFW